MGDGPNGGLCVAQDMLDGRIAEAKAAGCTEAGHKAMTAAVQDVAMCFRYLADHVERLPERVSERMRSDVVTLVQAHAEDAVKKHLAMRVPAGQAAVVSRDGPADALPSGAWAAALAIISRAPMAATVCAVTGFLTFSVYVLAKGLKII